MASVLDFQSLEATPTRGCISWFSVSITVNPE